MEEVQDWFFLKKIGGGSSGGCCFLFCRVEEEGWLVIVEVMVVKRVEESMD